jgi:hypothetical protein
MNSAICYYPWNLFSYECGLVLGTAVGRNHSSFLFYLGVFLLTCSLESIFYFIAAKKQKLTHSKTIEQILVLNLATHPIVFFIFPLLLEKAGSDILTYIWTAELFAFAIEALLLKFRYRYSWTMAILTSGLANLFSWSVGIWLQTINLL